MRDGIYLFFACVVLAIGCADPESDDAPRTGDQGLGSDGGLVLDEGLDPDGGDPADATIEADAATPDAAPDGPPPDAALEGCEPGEESAEPCSQAGVCRGRMATCQADRTFGECAEPAGYEADETTCDGLDNDCDGATDEAFPDVNGACDGDDDDACALGQWRCNEAGDGLVCADDESVSEVCNGLDDDCDGTIDEDAPDAPPADRQEGVCAGTLRTCGGEDGWIEPDYTEIPAYEPFETQCDGLDNDCDGRVDRGLFPPPSDIQAGVCAGAQAVCDGEGGWVEPDYAARADYEADEGTCDGLDNDCDGTVDEAVTPPDCALDQGVCAFPSALPECRGADGFSECEYGPDYEVDEADTCDALDNDCDGVVDEGEACDISLQVVYVEPGSYLRGSPEGELGRDDDEAQHDVQISRAVLVRATEVTQAEWVAVTGDENPSFHLGADRPVEQTSWLDAVQFLNALSLAEGLSPCYEINGLDVTWPEGLTCDGWRLPTEGEWEFVARAGTEGAHYGLDEALDLPAVAWHQENAASTTHPVAELAPNAYGLYDALGNVSEWVWDRYGEYPMGLVIDPVGPEDGDQIGRGGGFATRANRVRAANRAEFAPSSRNRDLGLRPVRTAPGPRGEE